MAAEISVEQVAGKLNRVGYESFIQGLRQAKSAGNRNLELAHWFLHLLQKDRTDLALTADKYKLNRAKTALGRHGGGERIPPQRDGNARNIGPSR